MSNTQPPKPSAAAMRAATGIMHAIEETFFSKNSSHPNEHRMAQIIDRETGVTELVEALALLNEMVMRTRVYYAYVSGSGYAQDERTLEQARALLAKHRAKEASQ